MSLPRWTKGLLVLGGIGCATPGLPPEQLSEVNAAVRAANELGAATLPAPSLHLQLAREEVALAIKLAERGESDHAARVLDRALADAELALALTRTTAASESAARAQASRQQLEEDSR